MKNKLKFSKYPYPYLLVNNCLDNKIFRSIIKNKEKFKKFSKNSKIVLNNPNAPKERNIFKIVEKNKIIRTKIKMLDDISYNILDNFNKKMFDDIILKFNLSKNIKKKTHLNMMFCWDKPGYINNVHTDTKRKVFSCVLYLFSSLSKNAGTKILLNKKRKFLKYKSIIPKKNLLFSFKRTNNSFHSVEKSNNHRFVLLINCNKK